MPLILVSPAGDRRFSLAGRDSLIVGRDPVSDLPVLHPAVSRRHAELQADEATESIAVIDLASRNGTWINGQRVSRGTAVVGDTLAFGTVAFEVRRVEATTQRPTPSISSVDPGSTLLRERLVPSRDQALADVAAGHERATQRLTQLVQIAQRLGSLGELDALLDAIASDLFATFDADRVAVLLAAGPQGELETRISRDRHGHIPRPVPRAIANGVAERQVALLTNDAAVDVRTAGESVLQQSVKSAMAAPLLGEGRTTIGVLYVDHLRDHDVFDDEDLALLVAFAGIAAAAVERETTAEQLIQAERVRENFERYFTPQLAQRIASHTTRVVPGGERRDVVVLFSDIRSFTAIAESLPATQMAAQLNEYFTAMVECVFRHGGALDKFIGDAIMAYWGAPDASADDLAKAIAAAQDMQRALAALNAEWRAAGRPTWDMGVGIHAGEAFVGNIGSPKRLEYTLIGDTVNVASRLCGLAPGRTLLVSESVARAIAADTPQGRAAQTLGVVCTEEPTLRVARQNGGDTTAWRVESLD